MARMTKVRASGTRVGPPVPQHVEKERTKAFRNPTLLSSYDITLKVAKFVFLFQSVEQLRETLEFFQQKTRPSSRVPARELAEELGNDWRTLRGWEIERWHERLPMKLLKERTRLKVVAALSELLRQMEAGQVKTVDLPASRGKKRK